MKVGEEIIGIGSKRQIFSDHLRKAGKQLRFDGPKANLVSFLSRVNASVSYSPSLVPGMFSCFGEDSSAERKARVEERRGAGVQPRRDELAPVARVFRSTVVRSF